MIVSLVSLLYSGFFFIDVNKCQQEDQQIKGKFLYEFFLYIHVHVFVFVNTLFPSYFALLLFCATIKLMPLKKEFHSFYIQTENAYEMPLLR